MSTQNDAVEVNTVLYHLNSHSRPDRNFSSLWIKAQILDDFDFVYSINLSPVVCLHLVLVFFFKKPPHLKKWCLLPLLWLGVKSANGFLRNKKENQCYSKQCWTCANYFSLSKVVSALPKYYYFSQRFFAKALVTCRDNTMMQEILHRCLWTSLTSQLHPEHWNKTKILCSSPAAYLFEAIVC